MFFCHLFHTHDMFSSVHKTAAFLFYTLGLIILIGVVLIRQEIMQYTFRPIINSLDLPFMLSAITYGGMSVYKSVTPDGKRSPILAGIIIVVLAAFFGGAVYLNFGFPSRIVL